MAELSLILFSKTKRVFVEEAILFAVGDASLNTNSGKIY